MIPIRLRQPIRVNGEALPAGEELEAMDLLAIELLLRGAAVAVDKAATLERICELLDAAESISPTPPAVDAAPLQLRVH